MKRILIGLLLVVPIIFKTAAQSPDQRTVTTRIADLLAKLPAKDSKELNSTMQEVGALGEEGIVKMAGMLAPSNQGTNAKLEYALGGFAFYATKPENEALRRVAVKGLCRSLSKINDVENKSFILTQLQIVAKDDAVECVRTLLQDERLFEPAARTLVSINTPAAKSALIQALQNSQGSKRLTLIEALGNVGSKEAVPVITSLASNEDKELKKVVYYALAQIADPSSEKVLAEAAAKSTFNYEASDATSAYLTYARNLSGTNPDRAAAIAKNIYSNAGLKPGVRSAGLQLLTTLQREKSVQVLVEAASDKDSELRAAGLKFALPYLNSASQDSWLNALKKSKSEAKPELITFFGDAKTQAALPAVLKALKSKDENTRLAAISAAAKIAGDKALPQLFALLKKGNKNDIDAVKNALLTVKGNNVTGQIAGALPSLPKAAQPALIEVLAARAAHSEIQTVLPLLKSENPAIREAAFASLKQLSEEDNLRQLFTLLNEVTTPKEIEDVQKSISAAIKSSPYKAQSEKAVFQQVQQVSQEKQPLYFPVLAGIGNKESLALITSAFNSNNAEAQNNALNALSAWGNESAAEQLYQISKGASNSDFQDRALRGFITRIAKTSRQPEQKVLLLRKAMDVAKTTEQKRLILRELQNNKTYNSLLLASNYFDKPELTQDAAQAVMNIALSDKAYFGTTVSGLLNKTIEVLKGPDSDYQKESIRKHLAEMPKEEGFKSIFNEKDLTGWKGLVEDPIKRAKMNAKTLAAAQAKADEEMRRDWVVKDGEIVFVGHGFNNLTTVKKYGDIELLVDWKIIDDGKKEGDAGIYLRGTPQVQMWDTSRVKDGAQVGSGGLYNNQVHPSKPLKVADNPLGEWNNFRILMKGDRVTVYLNGELVTDNVILENYWDRTLPIFAEEQLELQAHGSPVAYRNIYIREIPSVKPFNLSATEKKEGFKVLFDGTNMHEWMGNTKDYIIENGEMVIYPLGGHGNLYTKKEYSDFVYRFEFKLTPGGNNGLGIRAPLEGDAAYTGMELQILDNEAEIYKDLKPYQYHGSVYGTIAAKRGFLKPVGEWNHEEIIVKGPKIKVILNGTTILDGDITEARKNGTLDHLEHPGLQRDKGHIGFLGHGSEVRFKNIRVKEL